MAFVWRLACLWGACLAAAGCASRDYEGPDRFALSGDVTVDGVPMDVGTIAFIPANHEDQRVSGGEIENGKYVITEAQGANAGPYRVEVRWAKKTGKQFFEPELQTMVDARDEGLPAKFHNESTLTAEVAADKTKFDFELTTK